MKILLVHNNYGKYSGEEAVVDKMTAMLESHGHQVVTFRRTSEGERGSLRGNLHGFFSGLYSRSGVLGLREALRRERPDIVNVHNLYPFISPAALNECRKAGVPVVMTVHNFRLICPTGLFMRDGKPCETCLEKGHEWNCIRYNCEKSFLKSCGYTLRNAYARWTAAYKKNVSYFACITEFQRLKLIDAGFDATRIGVIPNSVEAPETATATTGDYVAYIGRLSYEKGYDLLVEIARKNPDIQFRIAGASRTPDGIEFPDNIRLMGYLKGQELEDFIHESRFVVMPSRCYEGFPMAILEAASYAKPAIGPDHGGFSEIIGRGDDAIGRLFRPNDVADLERQIAQLWNDPKEVERLGTKAFAKLKSRYDQKVVYAMWEQLFRRLSERS